MYLGKTITLSWCIWHFNATMVSIIIHWTVDGVQAACGFN